MGWLQHARQLCECPVEEQRLLYRYSLAELEDLVKAVEEKESGDAGGDCKVGDVGAEGEATKRSVRRGGPSVRQSACKKVWSALLCFCDVRMVGRLVDGGERSEWVVERMMGV